MKRFRKLVPVTISGITTHLDAAGISRDKWTQHHGQTAAGVKVNSLSTLQIGDTTILGMPGTSAYFSAPTNDLEVASVQMLTSLGYSVAPPASAKA